MVRFAVCDARCTPGENPLRPNPIKPRLAAGGCAFGTMTFEFFTPGYPAICREAGAEFILYDMEHSGVGFETMKAQFASCRGLAFPPATTITLRVRATSARWASWCRWSKRPNRLGRSWTARDIRRRAG